MIKINEAIIVEGKYDKIKLCSVVDAVIIVTDGFGIFKDAEKLALIRYYAEKTGIVILTEKTSILRTFSARKSARQSPRQRASSELRGSTVISSLLHSKRQV